jgi:hypothetical protein
MRLILLLDSQLPVLLLRTPDRGHAGHGEHGNALLWYVRLFTFVDLLVASRLLLLGRKAAHGNAAKHARHAHAAAHLCHALAQFELASGLCIHLVLFLLLFLLVFVRDILLVADIGLPCGRSRCSRR